MSEGPTQGASRRTSTFSRFAPRLQEAIAARLGWTRLRPVQELAGAAILDGNNAVVLAPTAGGKTEASMFPALSMLVEHSPKAVGALYLAPIKALLNNQSDRLGLYTEMVGLDRFLWHGDVHQSARKSFIAEPSALLMTTPESLEVMLVSPKVPVERLFRDLRIVVIDEVHALAGTDRGAHLMSVLERIADRSRHDVLRVGLSATVGNPDAILSWIAGSSQRAGVVVDPPKQPQARSLTVHLDDEISGLATRAANKARGHKSLFFCESRALTEIIADSIRDRGTEVFVHHSSVSLEERELAEERFQTDGDTSIVCTSTLELGIDVGDLDLVFQTNAPSTVSSFLQRMGRTGRRDGAVANTTFYCDNPESVLQAVALIELAREGWVESIPPQTRCWPALVHQLLALTLEHGGIARHAVWSHLSRLPDLCDITQAEFDQVVGHMLAHDYLFEDSGLLSMGTRAERVYGKKNFLELYAVFSSPVYYRVMALGGAEIGYLEQGFVDRLVERMTSFLLGGRAWLTLGIDHGQRIIKVSPSPHGKKPSWGGFAPKFLGFDLCQRIQRLLREDADVAYLSDSASAALFDYREDFSTLRECSRHAVQLDDGTARWWTFAGGQINHTLKYALVETTGWKIIADNFHLRFEGDGITHNTVELAILDISRPAFWTDMDIWPRIIERMPPYRFSKFQPALPAVFQRELIGRYLLDIDGACRLLVGDEASGVVGLASILRAAAPTEIAPVRPVYRPPTDAYRPQRRLRLVQRDHELLKLCADLTTHEYVALDVETTLVNKDLCVIQFGTRDYNAVIDPRRLSDLGPIARILESPTIIKIIHNASFERFVFRRVNMKIVNIVDTLSLSKTLRGRKIDGGHSLGVVCERELGRALDKSLQTSNWMRRPLSPAQLDYAAVDVEVLIDLFERFRPEMLVV